MEEVQETEEVLEDLQEMEEVQEMEDHKEMEKVQAPEEIQLVQTVFVNVKGSWPTKTTVRSSTGVLTTERVASQNTNFRAAKEQHGMRRYKLVTMRVAYQPAVVQFLRKRFHLPPTSQLNP